MKYLIILNDPPYGTERSFNGVRLARELLKNKEAGNQVNIFLMGDAAACAKSGQKVPAGYYNLADMLAMVGRAGAEIAACGTCMDARGMTDADLVESVHRGSMAEIGAWTNWADKVIVF